MFIFRDPRIFGTILILLQVGAGIASWQVKDYRIALMGFGYAVCNVFMYFMK